MFCAETHSCNVWPPSEIGEAKMGLCSSKLTISEWDFSLVSLGKPLGLFVIGIFRTFKSVWLSVFQIEKLRLLIPVLVSEHSRR